MYVLAVALVGLLCWITVGLLQKTAPTTASKPRVAQGRGAKAQAAANLSAAAAFGYG